MDIRLDLQPFTLLSSFFVSPIAVGARSKYWLPTRSLLQSDGMCRQSAPCWQHDHALSPAAATFFLLCFDCCWKHNGHFKVTASSVWLLDLKDPSCSICRLSAGDSLPLCCSFSSPPPPAPTPTLLCVCDCVSHCAGPHSERFHFIAQPTSHGRY